MNEPFDERQAREVAAWVGIEPPDEVSWTDPEWLQIVSDEADRAGAWPSRVPIPGEG